MVEIRKLTDVAVRAAAPGKYFDGAGLLLAVSTRRDGGLNRCWLVRYTAPDGRAREMGLGAYPEVGLAAAREAAEACRADARDGVDPLLRRDLARRAREEAAARAVTFSWCGDRYIAMHEGSWKNAKHRYQWRATLRDYVYPVMGSVPVGDVDTEHLVQVLEPIWLRKAETASRVRARVEAILNWAATSGYRDRNRRNPAAWRGHLQFLLPKRRSRRHVEHLSALPFADMPAFMREVRAAGGMASLALEMTILCASRTSEVLFATWGEIDIDQALWLIPGKRMKGGFAHRAPLSVSAMALLRRLRSLAPDAEDQDLIFYGAKADVALSDSAMRAVLQRLGRPDITVHGFRSTFRDWAAERTAHSPEAIKMALAHVIDDEVDSAYRRGDLLEKRALLMRDWAAFCGDGGESVSSTAMARR